MAMLLYFKQMSLSDVFVSPRIMEPFLLALSFSLKPRLTNKPEIFSLQTPNSNSNFLFWLPANQVLKIEFSLQQYSEPIFHICNEYMDKQTELKILSAFYGLCTRIDTRSWSYPW